MRLIGYWMVTLRDDRYPLPQELVGEWRDDERAAVLSHLTSCSEYRVFRGLSWCRFLCGADDRRIGHCEFADGEWAWPEGLEHYVRHHDVRLPEDFIARALSGVRTTVTEDTASTLDYWLEWAARHRSPEWRERIALALAGTDAQAADVAERLAATMVEKEGLGSATCMHAQCGSRVLGSRLLCARHVLTDEQVRGAIFERYSIHTVLKK